MSGGVGRTLREVGWEVNNSLFIDGWRLNHPSEKYDRQIGHLPQNSGKNNKSLKQPRRLPPIYFE